MYRHCQPKQASTGVSRRHIIATACCHFTYEYYATELQEFSNGYDKRYANQT